MELNNYKARYKRILRGKKKMKKYVWTLVITTPTGTAILLTNVSHKRALDTENIIRATAETLEGVSFHYYGKGV